MIEFHVPGEEGFGENGRETQTEIPYLMEIFLLSRRCEREQPRSTKAWGSRDDGLECFRWSKDPWWAGEADVKCG